MPDPLVMPGMMIMLGTEITAPAPNQPKAATMARLPADSRSACRSS